jgi:hypothetical protein
MAKAYLTVRADVPEADRARFDHWYETDHLPWALRVFGAHRAWRCWSRSEPGVHIAFYEFDSVEAARRSKIPIRSSRWSPISTGSGKTASSAAAKSSRRCRRSRLSGLAQALADRPSSPAMSGEIA